jgi:NADP-dependent 3-hydroxy acid dehydrogenase YdfG
VIIYFQTPSATPNPIQSQPPEIIRQARSLFAQNFPPLPIRGFLVYKAAKFIKEFSMALEGKTVIITGAAGGIGYAIAERFLRDKARVVIADVDMVRGEKAERDLSQLGEVRFVRADVGSRLDAHNLVAAALESFGEIDVLVNNAGIVHAADFLDLAEEDFDRVLRVNLKGSFLVGQAVAKGMVDRVKAGGPAGAIINMSSVNAVFAISNQVPYSVSKGGVSQLTKVMALSLAALWHPRQRDWPRLDHDRHAGFGECRPGGQKPHPVAHADGPHRPAVGNRLHRRVSGVRRCVLHHRPDDLCRWRPPAAELHGAGEDRFVGFAGFRMRAACKWRFPALPVLM